MSKTTRIEFETDLLLVKHTRQQEAPNCSYELWMVPCTPGVERELLETFAGPRVEKRAELEATLTGILEGFRQDGVSIPVLWINREDEVYIVEES